METKTIPDLLRLLSLKLMIVSTETNQLVVQAYFTSGKLGQVKSLIYVYIIRKA